MIIEVIPVRRVPRGLAQTFTYFVSPELEDKVKLLQLVEVLFRSKPVRAVVVKVNKTGRKTRVVKTISQIMTPGAFITKSQLALAQFIAHTYFTSLSTALLGFIPDLPKHALSTKPTKFLGREKMWQTKPKQEASQLLWSINHRNTAEQVNQYINKSINQGHQILYLVPERIRAQQIIQQFNNRTIEQSNNLIYWRETLSKHKMLENWIAVINNQAQIIIGARSALLAPFNKLGLVIMEDESDDSYKSEQNPRLHAREVAEELARLHGAKLMHVTAAPSLETYHLLCHLERSGAKSKGLIHNLGYEMPRPARLRYAQALRARQAQDDMKIIDIRQERENKNYSNLSETLQEAVAKTLKNNSQVFLFLNRKGDATSTACQECGQTTKCPSCHLPLVYHSYNNKLICHHCRHKTELSPFCPKCSSSELKLTGRGTQRLAGEVKKLFPTARIERLDSDVSQDPKLQVTNYKLQINPKSQIIMGTEYAINKIDWSKVGVLGIINADAGFYRPDFRASERQYQLLIKLIQYCQLSTVNCQLFLQTYNPDSTVIKSITQNKPELFYNEELKLRQALGYPPFKSVIKLIYRNTNEKKAVGEAIHIYNRLRKYLLGGQLTTDNKQLTKKKINGQTSNVKCEILKPFPVFERKVRGRFQFNLIVKYNPEDNAKITEALGQLVPPNWIFDRNPETLL